MLFADDIVLVADLEEELQSLRLLDEVASYGEKWIVTVNHNKCGVLIIAQRKQNKRWRPRKETIDEVEEYKYQEIWINRQADGLNYVRHIMGPMRWLE